MSIPQTNFNPPFRFRRASHAVLTSRDLAKSKEFYTEAIGLVVSAEDQNTLYLRGTEERAHHSLVIKLTKDEPACERVSMRLFDDEELERAKHTFEAQGLPCSWVEIPFQGRTLHTVDVAGTPLELVATMSQQPRRDMDVLSHKGAAARRFDHVQVTVPDVQKAAIFYTSLGCRVSDYLTAGDHPIGVFLHVKDTPYDIVFLERDGPAFHHFAYIIPDVQAMLRACDTLGELGCGHSVEYGPGKHGVGHSYFVYLLDPDGHRVELLLPPIVYMDGTDTPQIWDVMKVARVTEAWGREPPESWFANRSRFLGCQVTHPAQSGSPTSLKP